MRSIQRSAVSISRNKNILFNATYPHEFIPIRAIIAGMIPALIGFITIFIIKLAALDISWTILLLPIHLFSLMLFLIGISLILSLVTLVVKDIENIIQYLSMFFLFITPIGYLPESVPRQLQALVYLNPLFYFIKFFQDLLAFNRFSSFTFFAITFGLGFTVFIIGSKFFKSFKLAAYEFI